MIKKRQNYLLSSLVDTFDKEINEDLLLTLENLLEVYKKRRDVDKSPKIPLSLFASRKLGILEVLVKCLRENYSLHYCDIGRFLKRNPRTIWATYNESVKKQPEKFNIDEESILIPSIIFSDRRLAPLESLTIYLKEKYNLGFKQISQLLYRNYKTIWLSYQHGIRKRIKNV